MQSFLVYPSALLGQLQRGQNLKRELSDEIARVLESDEDVKSLIGDRSDLEALQTDAAVRNLLLEKTRPKFEELLARSR